MWKMVLGVAVLLNAGGSPRADETGPAAERSAAANPAPAAVEAPRSTSTTLQFRNDVGDKYALVEVRFVMDGAALPTILHGVQRGQTTVVFEGAARPGRHLVTAHLTYQGRRRGIFAYPKGYTFKVTSDQVLTTPPDRTVTFTVVGSEVRGLKVPIDGHFAVTVEESVAGSAR